jgi:hypothetical protein
VNDERRGAQRFKVWFPMQVRPDGGEPQLAVSQNVSRSGLLVATAVALEIGGTVEVVYQLPHAEQRRVEGHIVRVQPNDEDPDGLWPYYVAVEFESPVPEMESLVDRVSHID